jgi:hypothetical protein
VACSYELLHGDSKVKTIQFYYIQGPFKKFVDWWQCAAVMQREA